MIAPDNIQIIGDEICFHYPDDLEHYVKMERLRALSPSAETAGERDLLGQKIGGDARKSFPGVTVMNWVPVGNYGLQFAFSDGHRTGIYTYEYLRAIGASSEGEGEEVIEA